MPVNKRKMIVVLSAVLALSLLLTACNKGGETPTGDTTAPPVSSKPTETPSGGQKDNDSSNMSGVTLHKELGELVYTFHRSGYSLSH